MNIKIGTTFCHWTTVSKPYRKNKQIVVDVVCRCGKKSTIRVFELINNISTSCGCKPRSKRGSKLSFEDAAHKEIYEAVLNEAKTKGCIFDLSELDVKQLVTQSCYYCGSPPSNIKKINNRGELKYNGIDRYNNNIGYVLHNCRPCCPTCSTIKLDLSGQDFLEHIHKIIKNNQPSETISSKKIQHYYARLLAIANQSPDQQTKVAAILIDPKTGAVMAEGYNGFIRGANDSVLPSTRPEKYNYIIHAETNLLCNAVRSGVKTDGCIVFCTLSPCITCLRMLWQAGIKVIYFKAKYSDFDVSSNMLDIKVDVEIVSGFFKMTMSPR